MKPQTVYIVDDDADLRDALSLLMRAVGLKAESYRSGTEFLQAIRHDKHGCAILDIRMPGMSGMELQAELHKRRIKLPIIFLTGHGDVPLAVKAMKAGAVDFIQKPLDEHRLVTAVMNALKHDQEHCKADELPAAGIHDNERHLLTHREREVLGLIAKGKQSKEIAEVMCISIKTVEFHRANIREKLGITSLPEFYRLLFSNRLVNDQNR
jgi:two-component system, LuxR family, response regulator FixJ